MDAEGELEAEKRRVSTLQAEVRRQEGLVDDFRRRAAEEAAERADLLNAKTQAVAAARRAERTQRDLEEELKESRMLANFLEGKVVELSSELAARVA